MSLVKFVIQTGNRRLVTLLPAYSPMQSLLRLYSYNDDGLNMLDILAISSHYSHLQQIGVDDWEVQAFSGSTDLDFRYILNHAISENNLHISIDENFEEFQPYERFLLEFLTKNGGSFEINASTEVLPSMVDDVFKIKEALCSDMPECVRPTIVINMLGIHRDSSWELTFGTFHPNLPIKIEIPLRSVTSRDWTDLSLQTHKITGKLSIDEDKFNEDHSIYLQQPLFVG